MLLTLVPCLSIRNWTLLYLLFLSIFALLTLQLLPYFRTSAPPTATTMASPTWFQRTVTLPSRSRGSYLITDHIVSSLPEIREYKTGLLNLFIQHTSCALSLNENWDDDVRADMSDALDRIVPEDRRGDLYRHSAEGSDDMPVSTVHNRGCSELHRT
jgi:secondary thiamine-phosphate synthase enzyme